MKAETRTRLFVFAALIVLPFCLRLFPVRTSHFWDETVYLQHAEIIHSGRSNYSELSFRPPLLSMLIAGGYRITHQEVMAHILVAGLAVVGIYLLYRLTWSLTGIRKIGLIASLALAYCPLDLVLGHLVLTDSIAVALMIAACYFFIQRDLASALAAGTCFALAVLTRFTSLSLGFLLVGLLLCRRVPLRRALAAGVAFALVMLPYLYFSRVETGQGFGIFLKASTQVADATAPPWFYFAALPLALHLSVVGLVLYCLPRVRTQRRREDAALIVWSAAYVIAMSRLPHREIRYLLPALFPLFIVAAKGFWYGIDLASARRANRFLTAWLAILVFLAASLFAVATLQLDITWPVHRHQWPGHKLGLWMKETFPEHAVVYSSADYPVTAYYSGLKTVAIHPGDSNVYSRIEERLARPGYYVIHADSHDHPQRGYFDSDPRFGTPTNVASYLVYPYGY